MRSGRIRAAQVIVLIVGVVNLLPILPLLIPELLDTMYQVALWVAVFRSSWRAAALVSAAVANGSYVLLAWTGGEISAAATRVMVIDVVVLALLAIAAGLFWGVPARRSVRSES